MSCYYRVFTQKTPVILHDVHDIQSLESLYNDYDYQSLLITHSSIYI